MPGAIADEQLVLEQQGLGGDGADATGAEELRNGDQQVDGKDEDFSHRANRTTAAGARKTARGVRVASHYQFATHRRFRADHRTVVGNRAGGSIPGGARGGDLGILQSGNLALVPASP